MKNLIMLLLGIVLVGPVFAALTTHYVSSSGVATYLLSTSSSTPCSLTTALANAAAGDLVAIKADGTYARTTTNDVPANSGTSTSPIIFQGYTTTPGDGYQGRTNGNGALITTNMPLITYTSGTFAGSSKTFIIYDSLNFDFISTASGRIAIEIFGNNLFTNCVITDPDTAGSDIGLYSGGVSTILNDDILMTGATGTGQGIDISTAQTRIKGSRISISSTNAAAYGINCASSGIIVGNQIIGAGFATPSGIGIYVAATGSQCYIDGNTIVGFVDDINVITGNTTLQTIVDNMCTDSSGYGINGVSAANAIATGYNRYRNNTLGTVNLATDWTTATNYNAVTSGSSSDYVSVTTNLQLVGGSPAIKSGIPAYAAIGALQSPPSGGQTSSATAN